MSIAEKIGYPSLTLEQVLDETETHTFTREELEAEINDTDHEEDESFMEALLAAKKYFEDHPEVEVLYNHIWNDMDWTTYTADGTEVAKYKFEA